MLQATEIKFLYDSGAGIVLAILIAVAIGFFVRRKHAVLLVAGLFVGLVLVVLADSNWRNFSNHGSMHSSIVYEIHERGTPPDLPLIAGERIQYFYAFHWVIASLMEVIPLAPPWFFALLNVVGLCVVIAMVDRLAQLVDPDAEYRAWAMCFVLLGTTTILSSPLGKALEQIIGLPFDSRLDIYHKFTTINNNQLGIVLFTVSYYSLVKMITNKARWHHFASLIVCYLGIGFFYPPVLPGFGLVAGVAAIQLAMLQRPARWSQAIGISAIVVAGAAVFLPWIFSLTNRRIGNGAIRIMSLADAPRNLYILFGLVLIPFVVCYFHRSKLAAARAENRPLWTFLILSMLAIQLSFVLAIASHSAELERKVLMLSQLPIGLIAAVAFRDLSRKHSYAALCLLALLATPVGYKLAPRIAFGSPVADPARTVGRHFRHDDKLQDELYSWLAKETPVDAVVIDDYLTVPVFARRSLYVGTENRRDSGELTQRGREMGIKDGWSDRADLIMELTNGIDPKIIADRRAVVTELLSDESTPLNSSVIHDVRSQMPQRPVFVVARKQEVVTRLLASPKNVRMAFQNDAATVFAVIASGNKTNSD